MQNILCIFDSVEVLIVIDEGGAAGKHNARFAKHYIALHYHRIGSTVDARGLVILYGAIALLYYYVAVDAYKVLRDAGDTLRRIEASLGVGRSVISIFLAAAGIDKHATAVTV